MSKKKKKRKPRVTTISGTFTAPDTVDQGLVVNFSSSGISIEDINGNIVSQGAEYVEVGYERSKNIKVLIGMGGNIIYQDLNRELCKYDRTFAIDTNTHIDGNKYLHIGALVELEIIEIEEKQSKCKLEYIQGFLWKIDGGIEFPEQHTWYHAIEFIRKSLSNFEQIRIGLIVDCDLGNLEKYNKNEKPYYDDFLIPSNIELIYSSADSGSEEFLSNKAIKFADKIATQLINEHR